MSIAEFRFRHGLLGVIFAGTLAITGCAVTGNKTVAEEQPGAKDSASAAVEGVQDDKGAVESINVVGDGDKVLIGMTVPAKYTVFKLADPANPNSAKLVIDMPEVNVDKVSSPIAVDNPYLKDITAQSYSVDKGTGKNIGRIVIVLKQGVEYDIKSGSNSLLVSLRKDDGTHAAEAQVQPATTEAPAAAQEVKREDDKTTEVKKEDDRKEAAAPQAAAPAGPEPLKTVSAPATVKKASRILRVESSTEGGNTVIKIVADGTVGDFNSFELDSPARVVVDVRDVENSTGKRSVQLNGRYIKAVRLADHDGKARLVLDASKKALPPHSIYKTDDTIVLTFGPKVVQAVYREDGLKPAVKTAVAAVAEGSAVKNAAAEGAAVPAEPAGAQPAEVPVAPEAAAVSKEADKTAEAPKPAEAARPADNGITIERVDFKKVNGASRLTVAASKATEYAVNESKDGTTVVIDIKGAAIPGELTRTLDAAKLNTPVQTISAYQESLAPVKDVRILIKLKDRASYRVKAEGAELYVDFAAAAIAQPAAPPVEVARAAENAAGDRKAEEAPPKKGYAGKKIDLDMMDANVSDVLRLLAEVSNLNIIASDDVKGTISLRLKNVPWDQAFDIILRSKELDSVREGNVVRVAPASRIRLEKEAALTSKKAQEKLESLDTKFIPVNYGTADDLVKQVKNVLSDRGEVIGDKRTNTLIVRDIKKGVDAATELVRRLDKQTPQVLIEARIVEASSNFARDLGIQWGLDYGAGGNVRTQILGSQGTTGQVDTSTQTSTYNSSITAAGADQYAVNLPATGTAGTLGALGFIFGKSGASPLLLDLRLSAGESQGRLKTISRPRITTLDNKEAKIEQGESIPFETTSASGTTTTFVDANLSLVVTPHITPDGSVLMKIKASRNSIGTFRTSSGQPSINKKESVTEVLVQDGETTVIGGIVISDKSETDQGIPYLKDLPVLGWLFKSKSVSDQQQELLIFITPTIIKEKIVG
ncbi:MAG: type IV pilus secretin PilQ [Deltaproteobacteria bacterium]|nr:type IV pilus secretin PilQ [Deltaproteobacteria bacterium]